MKRFRHGKTYLCLKSTPFFCFLKGSHEKSGETVKQFNYFVCMYLVEIMSFIEMIDIDMVT